MMETNVFDRTSTGEREISARLYNLTIGAVLCWGFLVNWLMVDNIPVELITSINPWVFLIGYFVSCLLGVFLFSASSNPLVSFAGYNLVVVPFGLIINMAVSNYDPSLVLDALKVTGLVTGIMMLLGTMFPAFFQRIAGVLSIALLAVVAVELFQIFILGIHQEWLDWAVVIIFCGYIGYDWGKANRIPKTLDNAVDSAAALYMDIINLFLRILRIMGRK
ncbi:Bax inhibitor-1 family protein [Photobacterium galatheae]|uniref:Histidine kinase n=1 Tax=Photobacterium galatheae TaxID=1654360 RepID=A0A066RSX0_9GAMM|nr:Bax inhibitor-1 family protein [Photobacterium galatheae]KDM93560.1 histidine kinase [Photobacterium galatheae]MCM0151383.1 US12 family protein [Photobacterium galatheae]